MSRQITICTNCNNKFIGKFYSRCGEKKLSETDFTTKAIIGEAFGAVTNLDLKLLKTFRQLLKNPGTLTKKYVSGQHVSFLKPFQIFLICNIIFFIFLANTDLFRTPSKWFFTQDFDFYGTKVMIDVEKIMAAKQLTLEEAKIKYDSISSDLSKSLLVLLIPFIALVGLLINYKMRFGKHLIFATYFFSLLLLATTILYLITTNIPVPNKWYFIFPVIATTLFYYVISIKGFYNKNLLASIFYAIIGIFILSIFIGFYRSFINIISLNLL